MKKKFLTFAIIGALAAHYAQASGTTTAPNPSKYEKCIDTRDKSGKYIKTCKMIKVHKKLEGTPVPTKK